jgi:hypothetical protein
MQALIDIKIKNKSFGARHASLVNRKRRMVLIPIFFFFFSMHSVTPSLYAIWAHVIGRHRIFPVKKDKDSMFFWGKKKKKIQAKYDMG